MVIYTTKIIFFYRNASTYFIGAEGLVLYAMVTTSKNDRVVFYFLGIYSPKKNIKGFQLDHLCIKDILYLQTTCYIYSTSYIIEHIVYVQSTSYMYRALLQ